MRPLEVSRGIDSVVVPVLDTDGRQVWAGWVRPPLRPTALLVLDSPHGTFGAPGAYVVVRSEGRAGARARGREASGGGGTASGHHAARVPIHERFVVFRDGDELCTDHHLWLGRALVVRLHYRMRRVG